MADIQDEPSASGQQHAPSPGLLACQDPPLANPAQADICSAAYFEASAFFKRSPLSAIFFPAIPIIFVIWSFPLSLSGLTSTLTGKIVEGTIYMALQIFCLSAVASTAAHPRLKPSQCLKAGCAGIPVHLFLGLCIIILAVFSNFSFTLSFKLARLANLPSFTGLAIPSVSIGVLFFAFFLPFCLVVPVMAAERKRFLSAFWRSVQLTRGKRLELLSVFVPVLFLPAVVFLWVYFGTSAMHKGLRYSWYFFIIRTLSYTVFWIILSSLLSGIYLRCSLESPPRKKRCSGPSLAEQGAEPVCCSDD
ncbi:MAG: hypothetical protein LBQ12_07700 [Deltaproteobacteria bacterium]|jgi:hypothetical protein|nr:hypothetical protein [Deltaproteobacteria bacterium]